MVSATVAGDFHRRPETYTALSVVEIGRVALSVVRIANSPSESGITCTDDWNLIQSAHAIDEAIGHCVS